MNRIIQPLLTFRDWLLPGEPEPAPVRRPLRPMVPPEHDVFAAVVHPDPDTSTDATVQAWLDSAVAPVPLDGCRHCDLPQRQHRGRQYAALVGPHWWTEPTEVQLTQRKRARDRAAGVDTH